MHVLKLNQMNGKIKNIMFNEFTQCAWSNPGCSPLYSVRPKKIDKIDQINQINDNIRKS